MYLETFIIAAIILLIVLPLTNLIIMIMVLREQQRLREAMTKIQRDTGGPGQEQAPRRSRPGASPAPPPPPLATETPAPQKQPAQSERASTPHSPRPSGQGEVAESASNTTPGAASARPAASMDRPSDPRKLAGPSDTAGPGAPSPDAPKSAAASREDAGRAHAASPSPAAAAAEGSGQPPAKAAAPAPGDKSTSVSPPSADVEPRDTHGTGTWERRLATWIPVWVGAIALALAGGFFVKYTVEEGVLTEQMRIILGVIGGLAMTALAEWIHRRWNMIAQGLSAAGVSCVFASVFAAVQLWGLLHPAVGFAALAVAATGAMVLSLRHGQVVAVVGLLGGMLTPALVGPTEEPSPVVLFGYLAVLLAVLVGVARHRGWTWLGLPALLGSFAWAGWWIAGFSEEQPTVWVALFVTFSVGAMAWLVYPLRQRDTSLEALTSQLAVVGGFVMLLVLAAVNDLAQAEWAFMLGFLLLVLAAARIWRPWLPLAWFGAFMAVALPAGRMWLTTTGSLPDHGEAMLLITAAVLGLFGIAALWRSGIPAQWAGIAACGTVTALLLAWASGQAPIEQMAWWMPWTVAAALFAGTIVTMWSRARQQEGSTAAIDVLTIAASACLVFAASDGAERAGMYISHTLLNIPSLDRFALTIALAAQLPLLAWVERWRRSTTAALVASALALAVGAGLLLNPAVLDYPIGEVALFNAVTPGYGLPALMLLAAAMLLRQMWQGRLSSLYEIGAVALLAAMLSLHTHHITQGGDLSAMPITLAAWGGIITLWLLAGWALIARGGRIACPVLEHGGLLLTTATTLIALSAVALGRNPLLTGEAVGTVAVFNNLLTAYGLPAAVMLLIAFTPRNWAWPRMPAGLVVAALALLWLMVSLQVRQAFHGPVLAGEWPGNAEMYTYSAAWMVYGTVVLIAGIIWHHHLLRAAALTVMAATACKVFILDMGHLEDLYRVLSFFGLGVSLLVLAFLYQRFVFQATSQ